MKKFTKVMVIIAATIAVAGIGLSVAGAALGGGIDDTLWKFREWTDNDFDWDFYDDDDWDDDHDDWNDDDHNEDDFHGAEEVTVEKNTVSSEGSTVSAVSNEQKEGRVYHFEPKDNLEIELRYDELILAEQDEQKITVEVINDSTGDVRVTENGNTLEISSSRKLKVHRTVKVFYPKEMNFREVELSVGAGRVEMKNNLTADSLEISLGAGEVISYGEITVTEADLEVGTGSMELDRLDAKEINGECGMGNMELEVTGKRSDYSYSLECGIGSIEMDDEEYSGLGREKEIQNPGSSRYMDLECGIGTIIVTFSEN